MASYEAQPLFISFRGITGCGKVLESTSNGFVIDSTPPIIDILATGSQGIENADSSQNHAKYQAVSTLSSLWEAQDLESGLSDNMTLRLGPFPGGSDLLADATTTSTFFRGNVTADEGVSTYLTIIAENGAGVATEVHSRPVSMDTTAPSTGEVSHLTLVPYKAYAPCTCMVPLAYQK